MGPTKDQRRAKADLEKWQKKFNERNPDSPVSLPPAYLPSAWACLALLSTFSLHVLFFLMGHWIVSFKAFSLYTPTKKVEAGSEVLVVCTFLSLIIYIYICIFIETCQYQYYYL
jgi:hypothetical protein